MLLLQIQNYTVPRTCACTVTGVGVDVAATGTMKTGRGALLTLVQQCLTVYARKTYNSQKIRLLISHKSISVNQEPVQWHTSKNKQVINLAINQRRGGSESYGVDGHILVMAENTS